MKQFYIKTYLTNETLLIGPLYLEFHLLSDSIPNAFEAAKVKLGELFGNEGDVFDIFSVEECDDVE